MILCIDAGNSRVKWGWAEADKNGGHRWTSIATVSLIEFAASSDHVNPFSVTHEAPERIVISNVAGDGAHQLLVNWTSIFDAEPLWLRAETKRCGVENRYEKPEVLGLFKYFVLARLYIDDGSALSALGGANSSCPCRSQATARARTLTSARGTSSIRTRPALNSTGVLMRWKRVDWAKKWHERRMTPTTCRTE